MSFGLRESDLSEIRVILKQFPEIESARIFGSRAKGTHKLGSDVDLAVQGAGVSGDTVSRLHAELEELSDMPYFFDVVDFGSLKDGPFKEHICQFGVLVYPYQT